MLKSRSVFSKVLGSFHFGLLARSAASVTVDQYVKKFFDDYSELMSSEDNDGEYITFYTLRTINKLPGFRLGLVHSDQNYQDFLSLLTECLPKLTDFKCFLALSRVASCINLKDSLFYEGLVDSASKMLNEQLSLNKIPVINAALQYIEFVYNLAKTQLSLQTHNQKHEKLLRHLIHRLTSDEATMRSLDLKPLVEMLWISDVSGFQEEKEIILDFFSKKYNSMPYSACIHEIQMNIQGKRLTADHLADLLWSLHSNKTRAKKTKGKETGELQETKEWLFLDFENIFTNIIELFLVKSESDYDQGLQDYEFQDNYSYELGVKDPLLWRSLSQVLYLSTLPEYYYKDLAYRLTDTALRKSEIDLIDWESASLIIDAFLRMPEGYDRHALIRVIDMISSQIDQEGETVTYELNPRNVLRMASCLVGLAENQTIPKGKFSTIMKFIEESIDEELVEGEWSEAQKESLESITSKAKSKGLMKKEIKLKDEAVSL